jgi:hypothetical protein
MVFENSGPDYEQWETKALCDFECDFELSKILLSSYGVELVRVRQQKDHCNNK